MHKVYEYKCPVCGHINRRDMVMGRVVCDKCGESFYPDKLQNSEDVMFLLRKILEAIDSLKASITVYPYIPLPYQPDYPWPQITYGGVLNSFPKYEVPKTTG